MPLSRSRNSLNAYQALIVGSQAYTYFSLKAAEHTLGDLAHLPCCMRVLLENLLRHEDDKNITQDDMRALTAYHALHKNIPTISFHPARFLIDDATALSIMTDLATLHEAMSTNTPTTTIIESNYPTDIVIAPSQEPPTQQAERYSLLKWGEKTITDVHVIPAGHGPSNHISLNALGSVVRIAPFSESDAPLVIPDTVLGTDPYFSTINGLSILGWNTDALEIESLILGHNSRLSLPGVMGVKLTGKIHKGTTATDIAIAITNLVSQKNPASKIIEFHGPGLDHLSVPDRAIISRMIYKTGALCCYFPIDATTLAHLTLVGHDESHIALVEAYAKIQGLWRETWPHDAQREPTFTVAVELPLDPIRPCLCGPNSDNSVIPVAGTATTFEKAFALTSPTFDPLATIKQGDIAMAIISPGEVATHPHELVLAGLIARKAAHLGLKVKPWVRSLLSDASPVSASLLEKSGLKQDLEAIGFIITLNAEGLPQSAPPILEDIEKKILQNKLTVCSISSIHKLTGSQSDDTPYASFVASPPLVIAYALAGTILTDINTKSLGTSKDGKPVLLKELWPTASEINAIFETTPLAALYATFKTKLHSGSTAWDQTLEPSEPTFRWNEQSCLIRKPPILDGYNAKKTPRAQNIKNARILAIFGDNIEASTIAPSGIIAQNSPAGCYLTAHNVLPETFLTYETKTGNYEVMVRGSFSHPSLKNGLLPTESSCAGSTIHTPSKSQMTIYDAAERYQREGTPYIIVAGKNFGHGSGQEWAAKVIRFLGLRVVVAESFDPMFRIDLVRLGVLPIQIKHGVSISDLKLDGEEMLSFAGIQEMERPPCEVMMTIEHKDTVERYMVRCDIQTVEGLEMLNNGSVWASSLRALL